VLSIAHVLTMVVVSGPVVTVAVVVQPAAATTIHAQMKAFCIPQD
jgi:hypothetical protein